MTSAAADLLCCPSCRGALEIGEHGATCVDCGARYANTGGIPMLVVGAGAFDQPRPARKQLHSAAANPAIYNVIQRAAGRERIKREIAPALANTERMTVLDVGGGTGSLRSLLDPSARYVWLDSDPRKLDGYSGTSSDGDAVLSNALRMAVRDQSVDAALCSGLSHHLDDAALSELVDELHRVVRNRVFFLDALRTRMPVGSVLWRLDRGAHPRGEDALMRAFDARFEVVDAKRFAVLHHYLFAVLKRRGEA